jgi:Glyoxalase-like domain
MSGVALDHVGVVARDLTALAGQYEHLGFTLTPFARQADGRIGNRCAMLRQGYIELLAVVDPTAGSATLDRFLARYAGIHILAFAIQDELSVFARLHRAGIAAAPAIRFDRAIDDTDPDGLRARFSLIQLPDQPEGRINLVRHLTAEALWQERFLHHPNNAVALAGVLIVVDDPAAAAARFSRLVGCPVVPHPAGGLALDLPRGCVRLVADTALSSVVPRIIGLAVRTSDGNQAIARLLVERGIAHRRLGDSLTVDADAAGGVALRFVPQG